MKKLFSVLLVFVFVTAFAPVGYTCSKMEKGKKSGKCEMKEKFEELDKKIETLKKEKSDNPRVDKIVEILDGLYNIHKMMCKKQCKHHNKECKRHKTKKECKGKKDKDNDK